jgi:adenylate kinase family enzyme
MNGKPIMIELVGPPGAGKTTFATTISQSNPQLAIAQIPYFRDPKYLPFFVYNTLRLLPTFLRIQPGPDNQWLTRREAALMVLLSGWAGELDREYYRTGKTLILDEGPVCFLARLHAFGTSAMKGPGTRRWWQWMFREWSRKIDCIIRLDLPDEVLVSRIRARDMPQEVKEMTDEAAFQYLQRIRQAQEYLLEALAAEARGPAVFQYDPRRASPDRVRTQVSAALGL